MNFSCICYWVENSFSFPFDTISSLYTVSNRSLFFVWPNMLVCEMNTGDLQEFQEIFPKALELEKKNIEQQTVSETNKIHSFFGIMQKTTKDKLWVWFGHALLWRPFSSKDWKLFCLCFVVSFVWVSCLRMYSWQEKRLSDFSKFIAAQISIKLKDCRCDFCRCFVFNSWKYCQEYFFVLFSCFFGFSFGLRLLKSKKKQRTNTLLMFWMGKNLSFTTNQKYQTELFSLTFYCEKLQRQAKNNKKLFVLWQDMILLFFCQQSITIHQIFVRVALITTFWDEIQLWIVSFLSLQKAKQQQNKLSARRGTKSKQTSFQLTWIILFLSLFCFSKIIYLQTLFLKLKKGRIKDRDCWFFIFWVEKIRTSTIYKGYQKQTGKDWICCLGSTFKRMTKKGIKKNENKDIARNSTNQNTFSFFLSSTTKQTTQSNTHQKKTKKCINHDRQTLIFFFFFHFSSTKQPNKKTKKRNTVQIMPDPPCQFPKQNHWKCNRKSISFFETVIIAIKFGDTTKALRLISDPKTNLEQTNNSLVRNFVVVWFVLYRWIGYFFSLLIFLSFFVSLSLFVVIEFVSVLLWSCIFCLCSVFLCFFFFLFFSFVGILLLLFLFSKGWTALHCACRILQQWTSHKGTFVQECQCELSRLGNNNTKMIFPTKSLLSHKETNTKTSQKPKQTKPKKNKKKNKQ